MSSLIFIAARLFGLVDTDDDILRICQFIALDTIALGVAFLGWLQWRKKS